MLVLIHRWLERRCGRRGYSLVQDEAFEPEPDRRSHDPNAKHYGLSYLEAAGGVEFPADSAEAVAEGDGDRRRSE